MLKWKHKLSVGIEPIDLQHRYFIGLLNRISEELDGPDKEYQARLIDELYKFTQLHFQGEENYMYKIGYPGLDEHRCEHLELLEKLHGQVGQYLIELIEGKEIVCYLAEWFGRHLAQEDQALGDFVRNQASYNNYQI